MKVTIDRDIPFIAGVLEPYARTRYVAGDEFSPEHAAQSDVLVVRTRTRCDSRLLAGSNVKLITTATIGTDHIDLDFCRRAGIEVLSAAGCNARAVLQWVAASLARLSLHSHWQPAEKCIGIVGTGSVGSLVYRYCRNWGFRVMACDPPLQEDSLRKDNEFHSLQDIARECDIVTFHVPLTTTGKWPTLNMAGKLFFDTLGENAAVLNSSRGDVLEPGALQDFARRGGTLCIDTWQGEPQIDLSLLEKTFLATPHIAGYSVQGKANASASCVRGISRFFGLPLTEWYPPEVLPSCERDISWQQMKNTIGDYFDIKAQSDYLKSNPRQFERLRNSYTYRQEYF